MGRWMKRSVVFLALGMAACTSPPDDGLYTITGRIDLEHDHTCCDEDSFFRIAFMVVPGDGERIEDFFDGIPVTPGARWANEGNARFAIPPMREVEPASPMAAIVSFQKDFPGHLGRDFELTFKEFEGNRFRIENAPLGRYYIWMQTRFDGHKWFHRPVLREPTATDARSARMDILVPREEGRFIFLDL